MMDLFSYKLGMRHGSGGGGSGIEIKLQEKTATENGDVVADSGYDGLSKVVVNVESSSGGVAI